MPNYGNKQYPQNRIDIVLAVLTVVAKSHVKIFVAITDTKRLTDCPKNYDEILRKQKTLLSWPNRLFQKDRDKTASAARILSPNPTRRPLPCLLIQSFFYGAESTVFMSGTKTRNILWHPDYFLDNVYVLTVLYCSTTILLK